MSELHLGSKIENLKKGVSEVKRIPETIKGQGGQAKEKMIGAINHWKDRDPRKGLEAVANTPTNKTEVPGRQRGQSPDRGPGLLKTLAMGVTEGTASFVAAAGSNPEVVTPPVKLFNDKDSRSHGSDSQPLPKESSLQKTEAPPQSKEGTPPESAKLEKKKTQ